MWHEYCMGCVISFGDEASSVIIMIVMTAGYKNICNTLLMNTHQESYFCVCLSVCLSVSLSLFLSVLLSLFLSLIMIVRRDWRQTYKESETEINRKRVPVSEWQTGESIA